MCSANLVSEKNKTFITSVHCMDGRIQEPLIKYLKERFGVDYVDCITEPGPCGFVIDETNRDVIDSIHARIAISLEKHGSETIVISGHHDCAGNPVAKDVQIQQLEVFEEMLKYWYPDTPVVKIWINERWEVEEVQG